MLPQGDKAMPRARHYFSVSLMRYVSEEVKAAMESNSYSRWPAPPWFDSKPYYRGTSQALAARALLRASLDAYADPMAESVVMWRDGEQVLRLLPGAL
jgi:hypothetical protein